MRILHFVGTMRLPLDPETEASGGVARVALESARAQAATGHEVWVAAAAAESARAEWAGVRLAHLRAVPWARVKLGGRVRDFREHLPLAALAAMHRFDVVHVHEYWQLRFLRAGTRVVHVHNNPFGEPGTPRFVRKARTFWRKVRFSDAQVAVSRFVAERLRGGYDAVHDAGGVHPKPNVQTVYNGVDLARFAPERWAHRRALLRQRLGATESDVVFLFAGALTPQKGVIHVARAFAELCSRAPNVRLVVAGGRGLWRTPDAATEAEYRAYEAEVRAILQPAVLAGKAHELGIAPPADVPGIYAASDVVVVPTVVEEAFGLVAAEALAAGKPVIASRVGGLPELITDANGLLVPPRDEGALHAAMAGLAADASLRDRLHARARESVGRFTWSEATEALDRIYSAAAPTGERRRREGDQFVRGGVPASDATHGRSAREPAHIGVTHVVGAADDNAHRSSDA
jgi:glycosyltransferase involved in cell wall biosynthesis